jgi:hypothetical protein
MSCRAVQEPQHPHYGALMQHRVVNSIIASCQRMGYVPWTLIDFAESKGLRLRQPDNLDSRDEDDYAVAAATPADAAAPSGGELQPGGGGASQPHAGLGPEHEGAGRGHGADGVPLQLALGTVAVVAAQEGLGRGAHGAGAEGPRMLAPRPRGGGPNGRSPQPPGRGPAVAAARHLANGHAEEGGKPLRGGAAPDAGAARGAPPPAAKGGGHGGPAGGLAAVGLHAAEGDATALGGGLARPVVLEGDVGLVATAAQVLAGRRLGGPTIAAAAAPGPVR